jgi:hypothetical protein
MNIDHSTSVISDQAVSELAVTAEYTLQAKSAWHRPGLTRIDIKRTMSGAGSKFDCTAPSTQSITSC